MTRKKKLINALNFTETEKLPKDLAGMRSTGISCFAYPALVKELGLPERLPKVYDSNQMLALPEIDVLDKLDCDAVTVHLDSYTNAFEEPGKWHKYDFNGRLPALVMNPDDFQTLKNGTITQKNGSIMPPDSYVFDQSHGGQPLDLSGEIQKKDLGEFEKECKKKQIYRGKAQFCNFFL